jgi:hypothetical protein
MGETSERKSYLTAWRNRRLASGTGLVPVRQHLWCRDRQIGLEKLEQESRSTNDASNICFDVPSFCHGAALRNNAGYI